MSFSLTAVGKHADVRAKLLDTNNARRSGGALGELTADYLAAVVDLAGDKKDLIVEANGHSDDYSTSLTIRVAQDHTS
jgi:hypothetical protein